jgi:hypothetical protein
MNKTITTTVIESIYLLYMYFFFKTTYIFNGASFEKETESLGQMFIHNTGEYENKVCMFGKIMAVLAVFLAIVRAYLLLANPTYKNTIITTTIGFNIFCLSMAYMMNLNAFVYVLPLILTEVYLLI